MRKKAPRLVFRRFYSNNTPWELYISPGIAVPDNFVHLYSVYTIKARGPRLPAAGSGRPPR